MKIIGDAPDWATELFEKVCKDYNRGLPSQFVWKKRNSQYTTGTTYPSWDRRYVKTKTGLKSINWYGEVVVRAGKDEQDQKLVLLHELAHHVVARSKSGRGQGHTIKFWKLAFELYERYGVDMDYAYKREKNYKRKATQAYEYHMEAKEATA